MEDALQRRKHVHEMQFRRHGVQDPVPVHTSPESGGRSRLRFYPVRPPKARSGSPVSHPLHRKRLPQVGDFQEAANVAGLLYGCVIVHGLKYATRLQASPNLASTAGCLFEAIREAELREACCQRLVTGGGCTMPRYCSSLVGALYLRSCCHYYRVERCVRQTKQPMARPAAQAISLRQAETALDSSAALRPDLPKRRAQEAASLP